MNDYMKTIISAMKTWVLKNRTHYAEQGPVSVLENDSYFFESEEGWYDYYWINTAHSFLPNHEYTVIFDDVEYTCVSRDGGSRGVLIGNGELCGASGGNNEPFCFRCMGYDDNMIYARDTGKHTYSISTIGEIVHPLPEKFLPDTVATKKFVKEHVDESIVHSDWDETDWESSAYIENKPFDAYWYQGPVETKNGVRINYLDVEFTDGIGDLSAHIGTGEGAQFLESYKTYYVNVGYNGWVESWCYEYVGDDGNWYPRMIVWLEDGHYIEFSWRGDAEIPYMSAKYYTQDDELESGTNVHTITIETDVEYVEHLDEKFIPDTIARVEDIGEHIPFSAKPYVVTFTHGQDPETGAFGYTCDRTYEEVTNVFLMTDVTVLGRVKDKTVPPREWSYEGQYVSFVTPPDPNMHSCEEFTLHADGSVTFSWTTYVSESEVDSKIQNAIGAAIGGSY